MYKIACLFFVSSLVLSANAQQKRAIRPDDVYRLQSVNGAKVSPDGNWVVYVLSSVDSAKDKRNQDLWMISWDGTQNIRLTYTDDGETSPSFSPDGKFIAFLSSRSAGNDDSKSDDNTQLWLLDRRGGEGRKITAVKGEIADYTWSPDGKKVVLVMKDEDYSDTAASEVRKPYVIDRYHFKEDYTGYLDRRNTHLYLLDIASLKIDTLTRGIYDESDPEISPDGKKLAFSSNRTADPDRNENADIYVMDLVPGAPAQQLTTWAGSDKQPKWSPDGKKIAYLQSSSNEAFTMYGQDILAVIPAAGGAPSLLSKAADRPVMNHTWSKDGSYIAVLMEDDRQSNVVAFDVANNTMKPVTTGNRATYGLELNTATGNWLALMSEPKLPSEYFTITDGKLNRLTHVQDSFLAPLILADVEGFQSKSKDGTLVSGLLYTPANTEPGKKLPLVLFVHGGPVGQDDYAFEIIPQCIANAGYAVALVNYRGSSGRGIDYTRAIYADWGNKEVMDLIGAADYLIAKGIADANRLGIGGWSYGGILTDYTIATDTRFKAGCSGAGSALQLSMYGIDQYITQYETELGAPWKNKDKWIQLSYPFFNADKIKTPTLFMASEKDFNVPVAGAEQMYQALKSNGIPAELVIYPGQHHGISVPSYQVDRYTRYINWYNKYLK